MLQSIRKSYEHTIYASYIGYITQAISAVRPALQPSAWSQTLPATT